MKLTMLGTGNATVTKCYNTCFLLTEENIESTENAEYAENDNVGSHTLLVDGGGGNEILSRLERAGVQLSDLHDIFVTHKHIDHLLGIIWLIRMVCQQMGQGKYQGELQIYAHEEVTALLRQMADQLLTKKQTKYIGDRLHLITVEDGEEKNLLGHKVTFFDIHSTKAKQFGFTMELDECEKLTCCGDEPCSESCYEYARGSKWLLHEAFCLDEQKDIFHPYEKHHSTVKDACRLAEELGVQNLVLYHTEDKDILHRKERYTREGQPFFTGELYVPEDMECLVL